MKVRHTERDISKNWNVTTNPFFFHVTASNWKTGEIKSAQYLKEFVYEISSILVLGLWSNGFKGRMGRQKDRLTDVCTDSRSGDYILALHY